MSEQETVGPPPMPTINLNGTAGAVLCAEWDTAYHALEAALGALTAATLHGRDFQTHPVKAAYALATASHAKRLRMLILVRDEVQAICVNLHNQMAEREDRAFHAHLHARAGCKTCGGSGIVYVGDIQQRIDCPDCKEGA